MNKIFDLVPSWVWALSVVGLSAFAASQTASLSTERLAHQASQAEFAEYREQAQAQALKLSEKVLETTADLHDAQDAHTIEAAALRELADHHRAAAATAGKRLQDAAREAADAAARSCQDSTSAQLREAAAATALVLADLRERADNTAGVLARALDDAHFAGAACERRYGEVEAILKAAQRP